MALVRAKKDVYLGDHGYRKEGEEFDYTGPKNHNLEPVKKADKPSEPEAGNENK